MRRLALASAFLLVARIARADDDIPEVRVTGERKNAVEKVPGSGTVLGAKDLARAAPVDLAEMLRRVPGVTARQEFGGGGRLDISIRGLDAGRSRRVLMLEDGVPLSLNPYIEPDMYFAPAVERYRAIEVTKGSANILFGPQTLAGTINFVTLAPPEKRTVTADLDVGSYGYVRGLARYGDTVGDASYVVQILHRRGDGFRDQTFDSTDALGKLVVPTGKDGRLVLRLSYHRDEAQTEDLGLTSAMWARDPKRGTLVPNDRANLNRYDAALIHEQKIVPGTKLVTLAYAYETDRIWRRQDWDRQPVAGESYQRILGDTTRPGGAVYLANTDTILDRAYTVVGLEPRVESRFRTAGIEHTLEYGGRVLRELAHYQQRAGTYSESFAGANQFEEKHAGTAFALHAQDRIAFTDRLLVTPGIRWEHLDFRRTILRQTQGNAVVDTFQQGDQSVNGVIPGVGIVAGTKASNVFGGIHYGFAPPRITSAISAQGTPAQVHAEKSVNYELGGRSQLVRWLRLESTGFLSNFSNQVVVNGAGAGADTNLSDAGATNILGVENAFTIALQELLQLPLVVDFSGKYTFSRATFRHGPLAGNFLPYAPLHTASANVDVEHASGLGGQVAWSFVGKQYTDGTNTQGEDITGAVGALSPWNIVDATVHYHHRSSGLTLRLTAKNLLDETYIQSRRPNGIFPGGFRQLMAGVRWEWDRL